MHDDESEKIVHSCISKLNLTQTGKATQLHLRKTAPWAIGQNAQLMSTL